VFICLRLSVGTDRLTNTLDMMCNMWSYHTICMIHLQADNK